LASGPFASVFGPAQPRGEQLRRRRQLRNLERPAALETLHRPEYFVLTVERHYTAHQWQILAGTRQELQRVCL